MQSTRARLCPPAKADPTRPRRGLLPVMCAKPRVHVEWRVAERAPSVVRLGLSREVGPKFVFVCSRPRWPCEDCARRSSSRAREVCLAQAAFVCSPATPVFLDPSTHLDQRGFLEVVDTNQPTRNFYWDTHNQLKRKNASKVTRIRRKN